MGSLQSRSSGITDTKQTIFFNDLELLMLINPLS